MTDVVAPNLVLTQRLELRAVSLADLDALYVIHSDPTVWVHHPEGRHSSPAVTKAWIESVAQNWHSNGLSYWMVRLRSNAAVVGVGGAQRQNPGFWNIFYRLAPVYWGNGYATELSLAAMSTARKLDPDIPIVAWIHAHNARSRAVATRLGLRDFGLRLKPGKHELMHAYADRDLSFE